MLKNSVKSAWHGVRLTSKNVEKCLDGTPFKIPFAALNSLIDIVDVGRSPHALPNSPSV